MDSIYESCFVKAKDLIVDFTWPLYSFVHVKMKVGPGNGFVMYAQMLFLFRNVIIEMKEKIAFHDADLKLSVFFNSKFTKVSEISRFLEPLSPNPEVRIGFARDLVILKYEKTPCPTAKYVTIFKYNSKKIVASKFF